MEKFLAHLIDGLVISTPFFCLIHVVILQFFKVDTGVSHNNRRSNFSLLNHFTIAYKSFGFIGLTLLFLIHPETYSTLRYLLIFQLTFQLATSFTHKYIYSNIKTHNKTSILLTLKLLQFLPLLLALLALPMVIYGIYNRLIVLFIFISLLYLLLEIFVLALKPHIYMRSNNTVLPLLKKKGQVLDIIYYWFVIVLYSHLLFQTLAFMGLVI